MDKLWHDSAWADYEYWQTQDPTNSCGKEQVAT